MLLHMNDSYLNAWYKASLQCSLSQPRSYQKFLICFFSPPYSRWIVDMEGAPGTLYEGEKFQLLFKFSSRYPFDSPQVTALFFFYCIFRL